MYIRVYSVNKNTIPQRRIESCSKVGTIISSNKALLTWGLGLG